jgi:hypothetical protein
MKRSFFLSQLFSFKTFAIKDTSPISHFVEIIFKRAVLANTEPSFRTFFRKKIPGANPTIASYNASVVNFYNATGSLARFENKNIIFYF